MQDCKCSVPPLTYLDFDRVEKLRVCISNNSYGEVSIETCKHCGAHWLNYLVEYEHRQSSGRWFRGKVSKSVADEVTPESAISVLEGLEWWLYGGSYFHHSGLKQYAPLRVLL